MSNGDAAFILFLVAAAICIGLAGHIILFFADVTKTTPPLSLSITVIAIVGLLYFVRDKK